MESSGSSTGPVPVHTLTYSANNLLCLLEDSADDLMQMLENNMPLTPALHALHEYMFILGYGQGALVDNGAYIRSMDAYNLTPVSHLAITQDYPLNPSLSMHSPTAMLTPMYPPFSQGIDLHCFLLTPVSTPTSLHSHSVTSETSVAADSGTTQESPPVIPTACQRSRCDTKDDNDSYYPPKKLCITTDIHQSTLAAGGEPPGPGFDPNLPHVANADGDDCNRGACRLRIRAARVAAHAVAMKDVLHPGEKEEEWEAEEEEVDQMEAEGEVRDAVLKLNDEVHGVDIS